MTAATDALFDVDVVCHRGLRRETNEDSARYFVPSDPALTAFGAMFAVADGVGSLGQGDVASSTALETLFQAYYSPSLDASDVVARLTAAIQIANNAVTQQAQQLNLRRIATTLAGVVITPAREVHVFNVGDSRVYRMRHNAIQLLTVDSSRAEAPGVNAPLSEFIGQDRPVQPTFHFEDRFHAGDIFIICTDGLWKLVEPEDMFRIAAKGSASDAARNLLERTLALGAPDNVTALVLRFPMARRGIGPAAVAAALVAAFILAAVAFVLVSQDASESAGAVAPELPVVSQEPTTRGAAAAVMIATHTPDAATLLAASATADAAEQAQQTLAAQTAAAVDATRTAEATSRALSEAASQENSAAPLATRIPATDSSSPDSVESGTVNAALRATATLAEAVSPTPTATSTATHRATEARTVTAAAATPRSTSQPATGPENFQDAATADAAGESSGAPVLSETVLLDYAAEHSLTLQQAAILYVPFPGADNAYMRVPLASGTEIRLIEADDSIVIGDAQALAVAVTDSTVSRGYLRRDDVLAARPSGAYGIVPPGGLCLYSRPAASGVDVVLCPIPGEIISVIARTTGEPVWYLFRHRGREAWGVATDIEVVNPQLAPVAGAR